MIMIPIEYRNLVKLPCAPTRNGTARLKILVEVVTLLSSIHHCQEAPAVFVSVISTTNIKRPDTTSTQACIHPEHLRTS